MELKEALWLRSRVRMASGAGEFGDRSYLEGVGRSDDRRMPLDLASRAALEGILLVVGVTKLDWTWTGEGDCRAEGSDCRLLTRATRDWVVSYHPCAYRSSIAHLQSVARCRVLWARRLGRTVGGDVQEQVLLLAVCSWRRGRRRSPSAMRRVVVLHAAAGARVVLGRLVGGARHSSRRGPRTAGRGSSGVGSGAGGRVYSACLLWWSRGFAGGCAWVGASGGYQAGLEELLLRIGKVGGVLRAAAASNEGDGRAARVVYAMAAVRGWGTAGGRGADRRQAQQRGRLRGRVGAGVGGLARGRALRQRVAPLGGVVLWCSSRRFPRMGRHSCRPALAHQTGMTDNVSEYSARHGCFCDPQSAREPLNIANSLFKVQRLMLRRWGSLAS